MGKIADDTVKAYRFNPRNGNVAAYRAGFLTKVQVIRLDPPRCSSMVMTGCLS